jgi:glycosyltransferase involved in cell wall biosynthesis
MATLIAARGRRLPVIFHADGLALDERVEFEGQSPSSLAHRLLRDVEAEAVRRAVVVIQLNERGCQVLADRAGAGVERGKFRIVHNGRDVEQFRPASKLERLKIRRDLGIALDAPLVVYAGTLGPQYCPDEMLEIFSGIYERRANARFLVLTAFKDILEHALGRRPELRGAVFVKYVEISEVPCYVGSSDLALAIILPSFSRQAADAIKIGEYLLCGVPVVATDVGRASLITSEVGLLLHTMDQSELATVTDWFLDNVLPNRTSFSRKCRDVGLMHFSLESAVSAYAEAVAPIITRPDPH